MECSLHLAAKHFIQTIAPHHPRKKASALDSNDEDNCASGTSEDGSDKDDNEDDEDDIAAGDLLGKAIGLVKQVSCFAFTNLLY